MQLTLFSPENKKFPKRTYHDEQGRFCTKEEAVRKKISYWQRKAEAYERAYLSVTKRLNELERNAQHLIKHGDI